MPYCLHSESTVKKELKGENRSQQAPGKQPAYAIGKSGANSARLLHTAKARWSVFALTSHGGKFNILVQRLAFKAVQIETGWAIAGFEPDGRMFIS
jgi:hypothetical protein